MHRLPLTDNETNIYIRFMEGETLVNICFLCSDQVNMESSMNSRYLVEKVISIRLIWQGNNRVCSTIIMVLIKTHHLT